MLTIATLLANMATLDFNFEQLRARVYAQQDRSSPLGSGASPVPGEDQMNELPINPQLIRSTTPILGAHQHDEYEQERSAEFLDNQNGEEEPQSVMEHLFMVEQGREIKCQWTLTAKSDQEAERFLQSRQKLTTLHLGAKIG
ncbi:uncharacterized protein ARMOST_19752 [Armillaria ostoyae]|uniref:Uncharacterized protein n=1 Tax=Armillaria ostoyae TaxID=47428 RepID=A0A284S5E3_ARMOS|nr:uncharacterized protein ARMOST_19752 [Armillaria ostoyae]